MSDDGCHLEARAFAGRRTYATCGKQRWCTPSPTMSTVEGADRSAPMSGWSTIRLAHVETALSASQEIQISFRVTSSGSLIRSTPNWYRVPSRRRNECGIPTNLARKSSKNWKRASSASVRGRRLLSSAASSRTSFSFSSISNPLATQSQWKCDQPPLSPTPLSCRH
jgi:hypothetical protein